MNKIIRFVFLPIFLSAFLSGHAWAINLTGTYKAAAVKYVSTTLPACQSVAVTLVITNQCGKLLKGSIKVGSTTVPVVGNFYDAAGNGTINLSGFQQATGTYVFFFGQYLSTNPGKINVSSLDLTAPSFPSDALFDNFILNKQ